MGDPLGMGLLGFVPLLLMVAWLAVCWWAIARLAAMDAALISKVLWGVAILAFPIAGLLAFLLLGDRTPQLERELGIRRL